MDIEQTKSKKRVHEETKVKYYRKILLNDVTKSRFSIYKIYDNGDVYAFSDDTKQWEIMSHGFRPEQFLNYWKFDEISKEEAFMEIL
jgi:hypothetical protein